MNRDFYFFGLFFFALYLIAALFQSFIFFQIGYDMPYLPSFAYWSIVLISTALVGSLCMLRYFSHQGYKVAFLTGAIAVFAGFCQSILPWVHLLLMLRELQSYHVPAGIFSVAAGLLFAISLVFSKAGKNPYLRTMGIYKLILGGFSVYLMSLWLPAPSHLPNSTITQLSQWLTLASSLEPVPLILLFYAESRALKSPPGPSSPYKYSGLLTVLGSIAFLMIMVFGLMIGNQSYWRRHISAATKALAEPFENRSYINSQGDTLRYRLLKPLDYNPDKQYPMVVCLHGAAGWGRDNYRQFEGSLFARMLSKPENREKYPAFVFVPQCPPDYSWGGYSNLPTVDTLVFETITTLKQEFAIDENRLYVAGHSLGGYGTWYFIGTRPDKFAAAIPVAGVGDAALAENMLDVAIWAFHGANDIHVPVSGTRQVIEAIRKAGKDPRYTESPHGGHSWEIVEDTPGVLDWLFAQKRE